MCYEMLHVRNFPDVGSSCTVFWIEKFQVRHRSVFNYSYFLISRLHEGRPTHESFDIIIPNIVLNIMWIWFWTFTDRSTDINKDGIVLITSQPSSSFRLCNTSSELWQKCKYFIPCFVWIVNIVKYLLPNMFHHGVIVKVKWYPWNSQNYSHFYNYKFTYFIVGFLT